MISPCLRYRPCASVLMAILAMSAMAAGRCDAADTPPPPKPEIVVSAALAARHVRVPSRFEGNALDEKTHQLRGVRRDESAAILGRCDDDIELVLTMAATGADRVVRLSGSITDFAGAELVKLGEDVAVAKDATVTRSVLLKPTVDHPGPFYLTGTWSEVGSALSGGFALVCAQANAKFVVADFESSRYIKPGAAFESSAAAKHRGAAGLTVRLSETPKQKGEAPPPCVVPLGITLPGRPAKLGLWMKNDAAVLVTMRINDPGFEALQSTHAEQWIVGPVAVDAGDWRYVELPMPGSGKPKATAKPRGESNGVIDYPLSLTQLEFSGPAGSTVALDDVEVWTQIEPDQAVTTRTVTDKPVDLLYPRDHLSLVVANGWLWSGTKASFTLALEDLAGRRWPLAEGTATIPPGEEHLQPAPLVDLPIGAYRLDTVLTTGGRALPVAARSFLVYQPGGKALPLPELQQLLADRNRVLADLGFTREVVNIPWHSNDNSPSVEPYPGTWAFDWIAPRLTESKAAGVEPLGLLGFTPLWADPSVTYNRQMSAWFGSTTVMPSRTIYWEEYVRRTIEAFSGTISTWVVWDRPDASSFDATPDQYIERMLEVAAKAAAKADPKARLISGAITRENFERFLTAFADAGADRYLHGIGILPSTAPLSPEDGYLDVVLARAQRTRAREQIKAGLWAMNLPWPSGGGSQYHVSEGDQATYIPRAFVICRSQGVDEIVLQPDFTEALPQRDSADLIYPQDGLFGIKPAALTAKTVRGILAQTTFVREVFLGDRWVGLARGYLFRRPDKGLVLAAWRREGTSTLTLPAGAGLVRDQFGNVVAPVTGTLALTPQVHYIEFAGVEPEALARQLERQPLGYEDAVESAWKRGFVFHLDVGEAADERAAGYRSTGSRLVGPLDSNYHNDYGRRVVDSGRHLAGAGEESFVVDVATYATADLLLRKRINYATSDQLVKVYCNDQLVGQWFAFKRDLRFRWRDCEFVIPNRFFAGSAQARLRFVNAGKGESTSYFYWAGPLTSRVIAASDLSLLVSTSGHGPGIVRDRNIVGGGLSFANKPDLVFAKGFGTNGGATLADSLIVLSLNKQYKRFSATVGIDAVTNGQGSVRFSISDGTKTLWSSGDMTSYTEPKAIDLDVSNAIILMLVTEDGGDGGKNDIADWAAPQLELK